MVEDLKEKADEMEKARTEKPAEAPKDDKGKGDKPKADGILNDLYTENERMEKNIEERKQLLAEEKEFYARKQLGGRTEAGQEIKAETQEEKDKARIDKILGTFS